MSKVVIRCCTWRWRSSQKIICSTYVSFEQSWNKGPISEKMAPLLSILGFLDVFPPLRSLPQRPLYFRLCPLCWSSLKESTEKKTWRSLSCDLYVWFFSPFVWFLFPPIFEIFQYLNLVILFTPLFWLGSKMMRYFNMMSDGNMWRDKEGH